MKWSECGGGGPQGFRDGNEKGVRQGDGGDDAGTQQVQYGTTVHWCRG